jgi:hypothetical protein
LAGSLGVADQRPAPRDPGRNQRPAPRDPERPGLHPGHNDRRAQVTLLLGSSPGPHCRFRTFRSPLRSPLRLKSLRKQATARTRSPQRAPRRAAGSLLWPAQSPQETITVTGVGTAYRGKPASLTAQRLEPGSRVPEPESGPSVCVPCSQCSVTSVTVLSDISHSAQPLSIMSVTTGGSLKLPGLPVHWQVPVRHGLWHALARRCSNRHGQGVSSSPARPS